MVNVTIDRGKVAQKKTIAEKAQIQNKRVMHSQDNAGHSSQTEMVTSPIKVNMTTLQRKAQALVEQKINKRAKEVKEMLHNLQTKVRGDGMNDYLHAHDQEIVEQTTSSASGQLQGVKHLHKLGFIPATAGGNHGNTKEDMTEQDKQQHAGNGSNLLTSLPKFNYDDRDSSEGGIGGNYNNNMCGCTMTKTKLKSGKFTKTGCNIVRQEYWPHNAVSRCYMKRTSFDNMDFEAYVAGEVKIIYSILQRDVNEALGRMRVLMLMAHWQCNQGTGNYYGNCLRV